MTKFFTIFFIFNFLTFANNKVTSIPIKARIILTSTPTTSVDLQQISSNKINTEFNTKNDTIHFSKTFLYSIDSTIPKEVIEYSIIQGNKINSSSLEALDLNSNKNVPITISNVKTLTNGDIAITLNSDLDNNKYFFDGNVYLKFKDTLD